MDFAARAAPANKPAASTRTLRHDRRTFYMESRDTSAFIRAAVNYSCAMHGTRHSTLFQTSTCSHLINVRCRMLVLKLRLTMHRGHKTGRIANLMDVLADAKECMACSVTSY